MSAQPEQLSILACRLFPVVAAAAVGEATVRVVERRMERRRRMVRVDECMLACLLLFDGVLLIATELLAIGFWILVCSRWRSL